MGEASYNADFGLWAGWQPYLITTLCQGSTVLVLSLIMIPNSVSTEEHRKKLTRVPAEGKQQVRWWVQWRRALEAQQPQQVRWRWQQQQHLPSLILPQLLAHHHNQIYQVASGIVTSISHFKIGIGKHYTKVLIKTTDASYHL